MKVIIVDNKHNWLHSFILQIFGYFGYIINNSKENMPLSVWSRKEDN